MSLAPSEPDNNDNNDVRRILRATVERYYVYTFTNLTLIIPSLLLISTFLYL